MRRDAVRAAAAHLSARAARAQRLLLPGEESAAVRLFPGRPQGRVQHAAARSSSPACRTTSSRTRRRMPCSTACIPASTKPTNPDVLAFHEAFADIVALFQHFSLSRRAASIRSRRRAAILHSENLLGQLAQQFGRATGPRRRAARRAGRHGQARERGRRAHPTPHALDTRLGAARPRRHPGRRRLRRFPADLPRAHGRPVPHRDPGHGRAARTARSIPTCAPARARRRPHARDHILQMCIRAIDYCPPVDITFGDLSARLITADLDYATPRTSENYPRRVRRELPPVGDLPARPAQHVGRRAAWPTGEEVMDEEGLYAAEASLLWRRAPGRRSRCSGTAAELEPRQRPLPDWQGVDDKLAFYGAG